MIKGNIFCYCLIQNSYHKGKVLTQELGFNILKKSETYKLIESSLSSMSIFSGNSILNIMGILLLT